jgi:protein-S-isoprenylcysteine O-methyltransferase Ste14
MGHRLPRRGQLVTDGIYRYLGHRQNLGLILIGVGFNIMWPTLLIVVMAPVLIATYVRLARREDEELARAFGEAFLEYGALTPALVPWGRRSADPRRGTATPGAAVLPADAGRSEG